MLKVVVNFYIKAYLKSTLFSNKQQLEIDCLKV